MTSLTGSFPAVVDDAGQAREPRAGRVRAGPGSLESRFAGSGYLLPAARWMASKEKFMVLFRPWNVLSAVAGTVSWTRR
jgi:hypothetical protein